MQALQRLHLEDNRIETIERRSFMNLERLRHLSLRGNKITSISDETFQVRKYEFKEEQQKKPLQSCDIPQLLSDTNAISER